MREPSPWRVALPWLLLTVLGLPWLRATLPAPPVAQARPVAQATTLADTTPTPTLDTPPPTTPPPTTHPPTETPTPTPTADYHLLLPLVEQGRPLIRYEWVTVTSPTTNTLRGVDMISATDGWAVGDNGTIIHWNGQAWTSVASPTTQKLNAVSMVSATDGWAVGDGGTVLRWDGRAWTLYPWTQGTPPNLKAVVMLSATEGWMGGYTEPSCPMFRDCSFATKLIRWDGREWTPTVFVCDYGVGVCLRLFALAFASPSEGWAMGNGGPLHWDGQSWSQRLDPALVDSVAALSATEAWAIEGFYGVYHWDGQTWTHMDVPGLAPLAVYMVTASDVWIGGWTFQHWDGRTWTIAPGPVGLAIDSIDMLSAHEGWAVGRGGAITRYTPRPAPWP